MTRKQLENYLILFATIHEGKSVSIVLADDDIDDQLLFEEAIIATKVPAKLKILDNGDYLMDHLHSLNGVLPDVIFLDLNMPCKNGIECLELIRKNDKLKDI